MTYPIYFLIFMNTLIFSEPSIDSCKEDNGTFFLTVYQKSVKCGFINILKEKGQVTFQFACGGNNFGKGFSNLNEVDFEYKNQYLTMIKKTTNRTIFKIKCKQEIFDELKIFLADANL